MTTSAIQIVTTTARQEDAIRIADHLVARRLAACVQITTVRSVYRWQGNIESEDEFQCAIKTRMERFAEIEAEIRVIHPYDVPEIIALPIIDGSADYLRWLEEQVHVERTDDEGQDEG